MRSPDSLVSLPLACSLGVVVAILLPACTGVTLKAPFSGYSHAYAEAQNEQMLLNLARLDHGHPAYFLAIGPINNKFNLAAETTVGGTRTDSEQISGTKTLTRVGTAPLQLVGRTMGRVASLVTAGTVGGRVAGSSSPDFQFIPLNNDLVAKQFFDPIQQDVFFTLYQQGYPIDQLLRVMIERIETTLPTRESLVLFNSPTRGQPEAFARFLRTCALLREMQRTGELVLDARRDTVVVWTGAPGWAPTPEELLKAETSTLRYRQGPDGAWQMIREQTVPTFFLKPGHASRLKAQLAASGVTRDVQAIDNLVQMLNGGIVVRSRAADGGGEPTRLILRSYSRALEAVAAEQGAFDALMRRPGFPSMVPDNQRYPILRTRWKDRHVPLHSPLLRLTYAGDDYQITDPVMVDSSPNARWNRDVFRLLVGLGAQVNVDLSKFQRQVIELR